MQTPRMGLSTPLSWRKGWKLYRAQEYADSRGNARKRYPETPDYVGEAGKPSGVCWQIRTAQWALEELGEQAEGGASFDLFDDSVGVKPFDRCAFGGYLWEVRSVVERSGWRQIGLVEVKADGG